MPETCVGCGIAAKAIHPIVGIARAELDNQSADTPYVAHAVCDACWRDPEHRTLRQLKMHFHFRANERLAVQIANKLDDDLRAGKDIGIG